MSKQTHQLVGPVIGALPYRRREFQQNCALSLNRYTTVGEPAPGWADWNYSHSAAAFVDLKLPKGFSDLLAAIVDRSGAYSGAFAARLQDSGAQVLEYGEKAGVDDVRGTENTLTGRVSCLPAADTDGEVH